MPARLRDQRDGDIRVLPSPLGARERAARARSRIDLDVEAAVGVETDGDAERNRTVRTLDRVLPGHAGKRDAADDDTVERRADGNRRALLVDVRPRIAGNSGGRPENAVGPLGLDAERPADVGNALEPCEVHGVAAALALPDLDLGAGAAAPAEHAEDGDRERCEQCEECSPFHDGYVYMVDGNSPSIRNTTGDRSMDI